MDIVPKLLVDADGEDWDDGLLVGELPEPELEDWDWFTFTVT